ncbi:hypothetical protein [Lacticaseibacillus saniviri]|uniref:Uncharacterized protein n=1 Tax=Lacticaseibacillus saniviri JCM 17471 = DSM 24301 TaxID=1293598 RepID=A0A0R2MZV0_9LACO|nr:hypothetical protein [Lacticaseibacillus saniviri]KRO18364.1 hypothetical protein IV56_GL001496 [Lacticaseibacillus saniviri JCM 17471 = DSM 24301]MCG4282184.1 hypothetical protein [Lacticaseibacillus saniviri]
MAEVKTRKEYREEQERAAREAKKRDQQRQSVERDYAKKTREQTRDNPVMAEPKVHNLKVRLNWAIGIVLGLLVIVFLVLFLV